MKFKGYPNAKAERESLEALLTALQGGPDTGLAQLQGKVDPDSIRRKLIILVNDKRYDEAATLIHGLPPEEFWCDIAIQALALNGEFQEAERIFQVSRGFNNRVKRDKSAFAF